MTKRLLLLLIFCNVNLAAQSVVDGVFAVFTFKREVFHKVEVFYWITPQDSILSHDNGRFCIYPLYLASEETVSWSALVNENGDPESSLPFCKKVLANHEKVQTIRSTHRTVIYKSKPKEKTLTEKTTVYLTFVSGRFLIGELQSNNMINRYYPIKAYSPIGEILIVKKEKNDRIYRAAKMTDYQGIAFSITQLASYPFDRENGKAYQEPYQ